MMPKPRKPVTTGRPSTYDPAYCDQIVDYLSNGYSVTAFAGSIGVARSTVYKWADEHPLFSDALKTGQAKSSIWWEDCLREIVIGGEGNATAAIFGLKNRSADEWREKVVNEHTGEGGGPIQTEDVTHGAESFASKMAMLAARSVSDSGDGETDAAGDGGP